MMGLEPQSDVNCYVSSAEEYRRTFLPDGMKSNGDAVLAAARHQHQVESSRESAGPPDRYDGVTGIPVKRKRWSATSLTRLGSCPFKWFASDVLKLNTPIEAEGELRGDVCGRLYHKTLELSVKRSPKCGDVRSAVLEVLEEEFANAELDDEFLSYVANWELRRGELLERLRLAVVSDDFFPDGAEVLGTEREFEAELAGVLVHGKVDRIDRLSDGRLFALDYKSGLSVARVKDESGYLRTDLQLPIYSTVALPTLYPNEPVAAGGFFSIKDSKLTRGKEVDLKAIIRKLLALVDRGEFAVDPDVKQDACEFCEFDIVCRRGPRNLKKAVSQ
jgi:ATP-dependent helicase/DNAse subunit B